MRTLFILFLTAACMPRPGHAVIVESRGATQSANSARQLSATAELSVVHHAAIVARLFKTDLATVQAAYDLNLTERLTWVLLRLSSDANCAPAQLMLERKTRSWGEVAQLHGHGWSALMDELDDLMAGAGWSWTLPSQAQLQRSSANDPGSLERGRKQ